MSTAIAERPSVAPNTIVKAVDLQEHLTSTGMLDEISRLLEGVLDSKRFIRVALNAINRDTNLQQCTLASVIRALMHSAECGLEIGGALGEAYLVAYGKEATFMAGYKGLLRLARDSGEFKDIFSEVVHDLDEFNLEMGSAPFVYHKPSFARERGPVVAANCKGVYLAAELINGAKRVAFMSTEEVEDIRKRAPSANSPAWKNYWGEMARKTLLKRATKQLPRATRLDRAIELDNEGEVMMANVADDRPKGIAGVQQRIAERSNGNGHATDAPVAGECPECGLRNGLHKAACSMKNAPAPTDTPCPTCNETGGNHKEYCAAAQTALLDVEATGGANMGHGDS